MSIKNIQKTSSAVKLTAFIIFLIALFFVILEKPKMSDELKKRTEFAKFRTYGGMKAERAWGICADGKDIVIYGDTASFGAGGFDMYFLKTDQAGGLIYTRTYGGNGNESLIKTIVLSDGYLLVGGTDSFGNGGTDGYAVKISKDGEKIWEITRGGENYDYFYGAVEVNGGYILCGYSSSFGSPGNSDAYVVKVNRNGKLMWYKTFGGDKWDILYSADKTNDGLIFTGYTDSFGQGLTDIYLVKTDLEGNSKWARTFGGIRRDMGCSVLTSADNGFMVLGRSASYAAKGFGFDALLLKTDASGNSLWSKVIPAAEFEPGTQFIQKDDNYYVAGIKKCYGICDSNAYFARLDNRGNTLTEKYLTAQKDDMGSGVIILNDSYYMAGTTMSSGKGFGDIFLTKISKEGSQIW